MSHSFERQPFSVRLRHWLTHRDVIAVAFLSLIGLLMFWRLFTPVAEDRVILVKGDLTNAYFPYSDYQAERIWQGQLPLWNPYRNAGMPFAAEIQRAAWYPPRWVAILLAGPHGWNLKAFEWEIIAHFWLTSLMAYVFLRQLTPRTLPALAGTIMFSYGGYLTSYPMEQVSILESSAWLPLALLGAHLSAAKEQWKAGGAILAGSAVALSMLSGHVQTVLLVFYLTIAYLVFEARKRRLGWIAVAWRVVVVGIVMAGLSAIQWIPTVEMLRLSPRLGQYGFADKGAGYVFADLLQVIWPGVFVANWSPLYHGVAALLLTVAAALRPRSERIFWIGVLVIGLLLSVGANSGIFDFFYILIPGYNLFRQQERAAVLVAMAFAVLAMYGLDELLAVARSAANPQDDSYKRSVRRRFAGYALFTGLVAAVLDLYVVVTAQTALGPISSSLVFVAVISLCFAGWYWLMDKHPSPIIRGAVLAILIVDLFTVAQHTTNYVPDTPENQVQEPRPKRMEAPANITWHVDGAVGVQSYGTLFRIPNIYGPGPLELNSIIELQTIPVDKLWEVLAVRYVTLGQSNPGPPQASLTLLSTYTNQNDEPYNFFELQDPRPFAWLVYDFREASGSTEFARQIMADPRINLREIGVTLYPPPLALPGERPSLSVVTGYRMVTPERFEMTVSTGANALLTLALPRYPGWRATINGRPTEIIDVYAGLTGVPIPAGENQAVVVEFAPTTQIIGAGITAATLLAMIGYGVWAQRKRPFEI